jgi:osmoprotectant transport system permease protein
VVLLFYALYPITRNVFTGMRSLDDGIVDAAAGMGMKPRQRLVRVELPLIAPVVLVGVRIAAVQTTAAAILAALLGGGGLGTIVFFGVQQTAEDLILLGVIPIVAISLAVDTALRLAEGHVRRRQGDEVA